MALLKTGLTSGISTSPGSHLYNLAQLEALWIINGGSPAAAPTAAAVAMAESGGDPSVINHNTNGSTDRGLWQINSVHGALSTTNVNQNVKAAIQISGNGKNWNPWTTYTSGAYSQFIQQAKNLFGAVRKDVKNADTIPNANAGLGIPGLDQAAGGLTTGFNAAYNTANAAVTALDKWNPANIPAAIAGVWKSLVHDAKYAGLFIAALALGALMIFHGVTGGRGSGASRPVVVPV